MVHFKLEENQMPNLDAVVLLGVNNKGYFFEGDRYYRYTPQDQVDLGYPKSIRRNWQNWPEDFMNGIDAAFYLPSNNKLYFFKGDRYLRHTFGIGCDRGYPKSIRGNWQNWPEDFTNGIDAAVFLPTNNKIYFFKGNRFLRHTYGTGCDRRYPKSIRENWRRWPAAFTNGIDAALFWTNGKLYFFKGEQFIRHTYGEGCDSGYPATIGPTNWDGIFERYSPKRTIVGKITYNDTDQGLPDLLVKAWDADIDTADQMGRTITDDNGNYLIRYRGGRWDVSLPRSTVWRPDIVVGAFVRARDNRWSRVFKSRVYSDHRMADRLNVDVNIHAPDTIIERHTPFDPADNGFNFENTEFVVCAAPSCREEYWDTALAFYGDSDLATLIRENFRDIPRFHWALCGGMCLSALRCYNRGESPPDFSPHAAKIA